MKVLNFEKVKIIGAFGTLRQTSRMQVFAKLANSFKLLTIFPKSSVSVFFTVP